jgi:hypothetical protein
MDVSLRGTFDQDFGERYERALICAGPMSREPHKRTAEDRDKNGFPIHGKTEEQAKGLDTRVVLILKMPRSKSNILL